MSLSNKNLIVRFLSVFILVVGFSTCTKYPEGGFETRGPKVLLKHNGAWILVLYEVNGIDSTNLINFNGDEKYKEVSFAKESRSTSNFIAQNFDSFSYVAIFQQANTKLHLSPALNTIDGKNKYCYINNSFATGCYKLFFNPEGNPTTWEIVKLTKKELILSCSQKNSYKLKFKCR